MYPAAFLLMLAVGIHADSLEGPTGKTGRDLALRARGSLKLAESLGKCPLLVDPIGWSRCGCEELLNFPRGFVLDRERITPFSSQAVKLSDQTETFSSAGKLQGPPLIVGPLH